MHVHGGPSPDFKDCNTCQRSEWASRMAQKDLFEPHDCDTAEQCAILCKRQGDPLWTIYHQDFRFAYNRLDPDVNAPRGVAIFYDEPRARLWELWHERRCEQLMPRLRRQFAIASQLDVRPSFDEVWWHRYDYAFMMNTGDSVPLPNKRPLVPVIMYGHDPWTSGIQKVLDFFSPEILLTPYPETWEKLFEIPRETSLWFYPQPEGTFFARPNLDEDTKSRDLLIIGSLSSHKLYHARVDFDEQAKQLHPRFKVEFSHARGTESWNWGGPVVRETEHGTVRYLNAWSEYLGSSRFVAFAPCGGGAERMMLMKFYECLGSGAVPIMPQVPALGSLGIRAMEHYIPFKRISGDNKALSSILDRYDEHKVIARNAVRWYTRNADRLLYNGFESLIEHITRRRFPRRTV